MNKDNLTQAQLKALVTYDPVTGVLTRKSDGVVLGSPHSGGYLRTGLAGNQYYLHRLIWLYMTGAWPDNLVDHDNTIRSDNRWDNLRPATDEQNQHNRKIDSRNTSGVKGVCWSTHHGKWKASLTAYGKRKYLGYFDALQDASVAISLARKQLHGEFARAA